ncbi:MAG: hypothetical protein JSV91_00700 [Phycisphaerales bacterium]|nr:MAG: hypothetical protein JSV91_00700 [Phycisphaerales bacterium]
MNSIFHVRLLATLFAAALVTSLTGPAQAEETYFVKRVRDLGAVEAMATSEQPQPDDSVFWWGMEAIYPYGALDGPGEIYIDMPADPWERMNAEPDDAVAVLCAPQGIDVTGRIFLPRRVSGGMVGMDFSITADEGSVEHRERFLNVKRAHYQRLLDRRAPGGAWFRHQVRLTKQALGDTKSPEPQEQQERPQRWMPPSEMEQTFGLISGGRALSENLQLDRVLATAEPGVATVDVDTIEGITVRGFDWDPLIDGLEPETDPLARLIPDDQHAMFFPTFQALIDLADNADIQGTSILRALEPRAEHAHVRRRYERQLGLPLNDIARQLGTRLVESVAVTGSDPYLRTGSDLAILFGTKNPTGLRTAIAASVALVSQGESQAAPVTGDVLGVPYAGMRSPDRSLCSYLAALGDVIVVTNSLAQLHRLVEVWKEDAPSLAELPEYTFFRDRYRRGDDAETALLVLSDNTIRRWCGPRWRIGTSRRTRAVAVMTAIQAAYLDKLAAGSVQAGVIHTEYPLPEDDELSLSSAGVASSVYGTLDFQTPILELNLDRVTKREKEVYGVWRDRYQGRWRNFFDPIAVRFKADGGEIAVDVTVMPLIEGTEYGTLQMLSSGASIAPEAGDLHAGTMLHVALAINRESPMAQMYGGMAAGMAPQIQVDPLGWLGESVALYAEEDPVWAELADAEDKEQFLEDNLDRLPVVLRAEVSSGMKLTAFLAGARAFIEQTAPGMTIWENFSHNDVPYVRITPSEMAKSDDEMMKSLNVHYAASGEALIIALNEDVLKRALDRQVARRAAKAADGPPNPADTPWLGENLCIQANRSVIPLVEIMFSENHQRMMQRSAWSNIPILNEWKRRYPDRHPVLFHEMFWQRRLLCPGGGSYRWNEQWRTMESTIYGHPAQPKLGPPLPAALANIISANSGLTFEENGLRAIVELEQAAAEE